MQKFYKLLWTNQKKETTIYIPSSFFQKKMKIRIICVFNIMIYDSMQNNNNIIANNLKIYKVFHIGI